MIEAEGLTKHYGDKLAVDDLSSTMLEIAGLTPVSRRPCS